MPLIPLRWSYHGMGMESAVIARKVVGGKLIADIRLHVWSPDLKSPLVSRDRGAIHLHSFFMESVVLRGNVQNSLLRYEGLFEDATAVGPDLWNCWRYEEGGPRWVSSGRLHLESFCGYVAGSIWTMPPGVFHHFAGQAITLVRRWHVPIPDDVLTFQGESQDCSPPVNGRSIPRPGDPPDISGVFLEDDADLFACSMADFLYPHPLTIPICSCGKDHEKNVHP